MGRIKRGNSKSYEEFKRVARLTWPEFGEAQIVLVASLAWYRYVAGSDKQWTLIRAFSRYGHFGPISAEQRDIEKQAALTDFYSRTSVETLDRWCDCLCHFGLLPTK